MNNLHLKKLQEIKQKLLEIRFKDSKDNLIKTIKDKDIVNYILKTIKKLPLKKRGVYLQWVLNLYESEPKLFLAHPSYILKNILIYNEAIDENIPGIEKDFLKNITTVSDFYDFSYKLTQLIKDHKDFTVKAKDITLLFKNKEWFVLIPHSKEAAIKYGKGTQWCTSALNNNAFDDYSKNGLLIYFINKTTTDKNIAVYFDTDKMEIDSLWNAKDKQITLKTFGILIEQIYDKSMDNFYKFLEKSKDKKVIFGLNLRKAYNFISQNKEVPKEILMLKDNRGNSVVHYLMNNNPNWSTDDKEILMLRDNVNNTVAHYLAMYNMKWLTDDKEILMLRDNIDKTVAHYLAMHNPNWSTDDKEILKLMNNRGETIESMLNRKR